LTSLILRDLGCVDYADTWDAMRQFTDRRDAETPDEIWVLQHFPVFTRGVSCAQGLKRARVPIPVVDSDRGGQITYHGPGQLIIYVLVDLRRLGLGVKSLVHLLEQAVLELLNDEGVVACRRSGAPGVYVESGKIAALGLRLRRGCSYHGLSLNVDMDLDPFLLIDPCGFKDQPVTQLADLGATRDFGLITERLVAKLADALGYQAEDVVDGGGLSFFCDGTMKIT
jgi:lipoyl(octanoyl) transferase